MSIARFDGTRGLDPSRDLASFVRDSHSSRDLASGELWERSLARSRQRRRLSEVGRRARRRRKSASLAASAALVAAPALPRIASAVAASPGTAAPGAGDTQGQSTLNSIGDRVVLKLGTSGRLVAAAQERLNQVLPLTHLTVDGVYGPLTQSAVSDFQRRHGLPATGAIDARTWAALFNAPVLTLGSGGLASLNGPQGGASATYASYEGGSAGGAAPGSIGDDLTGAAAAGGGSAGGGSASAAAAGGGGLVTMALGGGSAAPGGGGSGPGPFSESAGGGGSSAGGGGSSQGGGSGNSVGVVSPTSPTPGPSTYVLTNGVALPLPRQYLVNGSVDQGVDYAAPGGTPEYAMGDGVIIGEGISGFGPWAPILKITDGPLKGFTVYYGHAGPDLVPVGAHVKAGQQISEVGYGIVGISTGPHIEIGFYPPGVFGNGASMLALINKLLAEHPSGRAWGATAAVRCVTETTGPKGHKKTTRVCTPTSGSTADSDLASTASGGSSSGGSSSGDPAGSDPPGGGGTTYTASAPQTSGGGATYEPSDNDGSTSVSYTAPAATSPPVYSSESASGSAGSGGTVGTPGAPGSSGSGGSSGSTGTVSTTAPSSQDASKKTGSDEDASSTSRVSTGNEHSAGSGGTAGSPGSAGSGGSSGAGPAEDGTVASASSSGSPGAAGSAGSGGSSGSYSSSVGSSSTSDSVSTGASGSGGASLASSGASVGVGSSASGSVTASAGGVTSEPGSPGAGSSGAAGSGASG